MKKNESSTPEVQNVTEQENRRSFLGKAGAVAAGAALIATTSGCLSGKSDKKGKRRLAMVIDLTRCTGCASCAVACKSEHNVRLGAYRSWVNKTEVGTFPNAQRFFLPRLCNHCEHSSCEMVCPTKATYKRADGLVVIDKDKCIGCRYCISACPYGARYFNWRNEKSDDISRTPGVVDKCDFCAHRIDNGIEPACVQTCPASARIFGDANDPDSEISKKLAKCPTQTLFPGKGTDPHVFYVAMDSRVAKGAPEGGR